LFTISFSLIKIFTNHHRHLPEPVGIGVSDVDNDLLESIVRFLRLLDCPRDLPVFGPMAEREVLWRLINGAQGAVVRQIGLAEAGSRRSLTRAHEQPASGKSVIKPLTTRPLDLL
jgi:hypothetical protein